YLSELRWIAPRKMRTEIDWFHRRDVRFVTSGDDLKGKTVVLLQGSQAMPFILTLSNDRSLGLSIVEGKDAASSFKLVETGQAAAFLDEDIVLAGLKAGSRNADAYWLLDGSYPGNAYRFLLRKGDNAFQNLVDATLAEAMRSGDYAKIYSKWFESPIPPKNL